MYLAVPRSTKSCLGKVSSTLFAEQTEQSASEQSVSAAAERKLWQHCQTTHPAISILKSYHRVWELVRDAEVIHYTTRR